MLRFIIRRQMHDRFSGATVDAFETVDIEVPELERILLSGGRSQADYDLRSLAGVEQHAAVVRFHAAKRRAAKLQRTPPWADDDAIKAIYLEARRLTIATGIPHHVDHQIPLQGVLVSGLHVHNNLQILTGSENSKKRNRFQIEP